MEWILGIFFHTQILQNTIEWSKLPKNKLQMKNDALMQR